MTDRSHPSYAALIGALALAIGGLGLLACAADDSGTVREDPGAALEETTAEVEYEPAYPEEVSAEDLSAEDARQQEAPHSHDGEVHAHDDEGEDDHDHGDDGHDH